MYIIHTGCLNTHCGSFDTNYNVHHMVSPISNSQPRFFLVGINSVLVEKKTRINFWAMKSDRFDIGDWENHARGEQLILTILTKIILFFT